MIQYGRALGMRMIGGVTSEAKAALVRANGAEATVDLAAPGLRNALREQVHALTDGRGVDVVMDMVGGDVFDAALRAIAYGGRIAIVGFASGRIPEIRANYLLVKKITAIGSPLGTYRTDGAADRDRAMSAALGVWKQGGLKPHVSEVLRLADWKTAFGKFRRRDVVGKIVMVP
jgi:NADPH2:quinone reductase